MSERKETGKIISMRERAEEIYRKAIRDAKEALAAAGRELDDTFDDDPEEKND